jgi:hypothetical protein
MSGKHAHPIIADGDVVVQLLRADMVGPDGELHMVEQWTIPNDKLRQMRNKDMIGWGYTLALPWATYNPALKNFVISVCYRPLGGYAFYARSKLNIQYGERQFSTHQSVQLPTHTK